MVVIAHIAGRLRRSRFWASPSLCAVTEKHQRHNRPKHPLIANRVRVIGGVSSWQLSQFDPSRQARAIQGRSVTRVRSVRY